MKRTCRGEDVRAQQSQRSGINRRPARVRARARERHCVSCCLRQGGVARQIRRDAASFQQERTRGAQGSVGNQTACEGQPSDARRARAQIEGPTAHEGCGRRAQQIIAIEDQGAFLDESAAAVTIHSTQSHRPGSRLGQRTSARQHRGDRSRLHCVSRSEQRAAAHQTAAQRQSPHRLGRGT